MYPAETRAALVRHLFAARSSAAAGIPLLALQSIPRREADQSFVEPSLLTIVLIEKRRARYTPSQDAQKLLRTHFDADRQG